MKKFALALGLLLLPTAALAHAHLEKSAPAARANVKSPRQVVLRFSEALEPAFSGALLLNQDGRNFSAAPTQVNGPVMTLTPGPLPPGAYRVRWHAVGHDTHRTEGDFSFTVRP